MGDPEFAAMPKSELRGKYDKFVNYYKVLGVSEDATRSAMNAAYEKLALLYGTPEGVDLAGLSEDDASNTMKQMKLALTLLTDRTARTMYDKDRDRRAVLEKYGLAK